MATLISSLQQRVQTKWFPNFVRTTAFLKLFGFTRVRMIWWVGAQVEAMDETSVAIRIPLTRRTKNHLGSMYFGALAVGADVAGGLLAVQRIYQDQLPINFVFKDFSAQFLKRPEADVVFRCDQGAALAETVDLALASGERHNLAVDIIATCPERFGDEPVATFQLTISLKKRRGA